jgi:hypothetical protein
MALRGRLVRVSELSPAETDAMFALMQRHFENVARDAFEADLGEKQWVIQVVDPASGRLCGFSTQMLLETVAADRPIRALFSGDTIIDCAYWGDQALTHIWGQLALSLIDTPGNGELYWFLISQGYRTYRFLPVFFHEFYPRHDVPTPAAAREVIEALGRHKFPRSFDARAGVVRSEAGQYRLRPGVADVTDERRHDPHVRFFVERNPRHADGDELCCLAPLSRENFTKAAYRVIGCQSAGLLVS